MGSSIERASVICTYARNGASSRSVSPTRSPARHGCWMSQTARTFGWATCSSTAATSSPRAQESCVSSAIVTSGTSRRSSCESAHRGAVIGRSAGKDADERARRDRVRAPRGRRSRRCMSSSETSGSSTSTYEATASGVMPRIVEQPAHRLSLGPCQPDMDGLAGRRPQLEAGPAAFAGESNDVRQRQA